MLEGMFVKDLINVYVGPFADECILSKRNYTFFGLIFCLIRAFASFLRIDERSSDSFIGRDDFLCLFLRRATLY